MKLNRKELYNLVEGCVRNKLSKQFVIEDKEKINCNLNMKKQIIRLTESDLHSIIKESVRKTIMEIKGADNWEETVADGIDASNDGKVADVFGKKIGDKIRRKVHKDSGSKTRYKSPDDIRKQVDRIGDLASKTGRLHKDSAKKVKDAYDRA